MNQISPTLSPSHTHWHTSTSMNNNDHQKQPLSLFFSLNHFPQNDDVSDNSSTSIDNPSETSSSHHHHHLSNSDQQRQPMFEKPLTPSDVGKLNRLVIPKQFAEKFFPLAGATGLLLGFEDDTGKSWRFRYSYWNSSQSYVLTKGWSRYVKEKKLDAGDVVLFDRHQSEPDRFFIGCRRRLSGFPVRTGGGQFSSLLSTPNAVRVQQGYPTPQPHRITANYFHAGTRKNGERLEGVNSKRVRLFGVNLECQLEEEDDIKPQTSDGSSLSSQGPSQGFGLGLDMGSGPIDYKYLGYSGYVFNHQDINSPQDFNQMRNRPG